MRKLLFLLPAMAMLVLSACGGDDPVDPVTPPDPPVDESSLEVSPTTLQIGASDQIVSRQLTVEATDAWKVLSTPEWIEAKDIVETGFSIDVQPYIDGEDDSREGVMVVEMGDKKEEVTVKQLVFMVPFVLTVNPEVIDNALNEVDYPVTVTASHAWTVDKDTDWITISGTTETGFTITVAAYDEELDNESREGKVVVTSKDTDREITVTQYKPEPEAIPLADYLGEYTITGTMVDLGYGGTDGKPYTSSGTMVLREDLGMNRISIEVLDVEENFDEPRTLVFTYDPTTGTLSNNNYTLVGSPYTTTTLCYWEYVNQTTTKAMWPINERTVMFGLDDTGTIAIPATCMVGGEEKEIVVCETRPLSGIYRSMIGISNVVLTKN